jgi:hypothetical protein
MKPVNIRLWGNWHATIFPPPLWVLSLAVMIVIAAGVFI